MVCHQYIRMNPATRLARKLLQPIQIKLVVLVRPEANLPVIATLNQVKWNVGQDHTWATWHGATPEYLNTKSIAETVVCPLFLFGELNHAR